MSIFTKLAVKNLKKNKNRTLITIVGIIISAAMICGLISLITSFQNFFYQNSVAEIGSWHLMYDSVNDRDMEEVLADQEVNQVMKIQNIGYAEFDNYDNKYSPYIFVAGLPENYEAAQAETKLFPVILTKGHYPQNSKQIIIPEHLRLSTKVDLQIGQKLTLSLGQRAVLQNAGNPELEERYPTFSEEHLSQITPLIMNDQGQRIEKLIEQKEQTFEIVGFFERSGNEDYNAPGYMAFTMVQEGTSNLNYNYYLNLNHAGKTFDFFNKYQPGIYQATNSEILRYLGISMNDNFLRTLYSMTAIFLAIILTAAITLISNAFTITLSERVKQFGILSSVGASKRQLRKTIITEAMLISLIALPFGIIFGLLGIQITLYFVKDLLAGTVTSSSLIRIPISLHISWISIVLSIVLTLVTVLISAYRPALKASRISPVEAIRQNKEITAKPVKVSSLQMKLFGTSGFIATKYYKHSKRKYRSTIFSLMISIILFITAFTFTTLMTDQVKNIYNTSDVDLALIFNQSGTDESSVRDLEKYETMISKMNGVNYARKLIVQSPTVLIDAQDIEQSTIDRSLKESIYLRNIGNKYLTNINIAFLDDKEFNDLLTSANLNEQDYQVKVGNSYQPIVYNNNMEYTMDGKFVEFDLFNPNVDIELYEMKDIQDFEFSYIDAVDDQPYAIYHGEDDEGAEKSLPLAESIAKTIDLHLTYFIDENPSYMMPGNQTTLYFPWELKDEILLKGENINPKIQINTMGEKHQEVVNYISEMNKQNSANVDLVDLYNIQKTNEGFIAIINIFCYGFIILISLIALTNVFNTITTNISTRKRDFAMLKSVGMSWKGFRGMAIYECILYGFRSILFGMPLAVLISLLIQKAMGSLYSKGYFIPWDAILLSIVVIFVFVTISMFYAMAKMKKMNIVETLKDDLM